MLDIKLITSESLLLKEDIGLFLWNTSFIASLSK